MAKKISKEEAQALKEAEMKGAVIHTITERIKDEYRKHSSSLPEEWFEICARKIVATFPILVQTKPVVSKIPVEQLTLYNELFPKQKAGSGKYMRGNIKNVETNFKWFFKNYNYTWEIIIEATSRYLDQQFKENYKYTRTSMYFIKKDDKSDLADWCEIVSSGADSGDEKIFAEKVV